MLKIGAILICCQGQTFMDDHARTPHQTRSSCSQQSPIFLHSNPLILVILIEHHWKKEIYNTPVFFTENLCRTSPLMYKSIDISPILGSEIIKYSNRQAGDVVNSSSFDSLKIRYLLKRHILVWTDVLALDTGITELKSRLQDAYMAHKKILGLGYTNKIKTFSPPALLSHNGITISTVLTPFLHKLLLAKFLRHVFDFCWIWECGNRVRAVVLALVCLLHYFSAGIPSTDKAQNI